MYYFRQRHISTEIQSLTGFYGKKSSTHHCEVFISWTNKMLLFIVSSTNYKCLTIWWSVKKLYLYSIDTQMITKIFHYDHRGQSY